MWLFTKLYSVHGRLLNIAINTVRTVYVYIYRDQGIKQLFEDINTIES